MTVSRTGTFILLFAVLGCQAEDLPEVGDDEVGADRRAIVSGEINPGDPAVVAVTTQKQPFCTATMFTPRHAITAAHCVPPYTEEYGIEFIEDVELFFGPEVVDSGEFIRASAVVTGPWEANDFYNGDIAVVALERHAPVDPVPLASPGFVPETGSTIRLVGYGLTSEGGGVVGRDSGIKRQGTATVDDIAGTGVELHDSPSITCSGDSGGPGFAMEDGREVVASIHSRSDCTSFAYNELVGPWIDVLVEPFLSEYPVGTCAADDVCARGCVDGDPDCQCIDDGVCQPCDRGWWWDPDCPAACGEDGVCLESGCAVPDPDCGSCDNDGLCSPQCQGDPDCGACAEDGQCNAECGVDPDCASGGGCSSGGRAPGSAALVLGALLLGLGLRRRRGDDVLLR